MSLVSVITPAYRAERFVARTVASVLAQTRGEWELLLVSDDGVDYRRVLAQAGIEDPRLRFLSTESVASGPGAARNRALAEARGDLLAPLDADDVFHPDRLARLVPLAQRFGVAGDNVRVVEDPGGNDLGTLFPEGPELRWLGFRDYARTSVPMTFVFRRDRVSWGWDEAVGFTEDTLFNLRGFEAVGRVPVTGEVLHEYRVREGSLCHSPDSGARAERAYAVALERISRGGLGFRTPQARFLVREMLIARRSLNRAFLRALEAGRCRNFQEFLAAGPLAAVH